MNSMLRKYLPGLMAAGAIALLAVLISGFVPFVGAATLALFLGIILANTGKDFFLLNKGMEFTERKVLEVAIVLLGFGISARIFADLGTTTWVFVIASVAIVLLAAFLIGKVFRLSTRLSFLLGAGSAICGTTAIGAVSPLIGSKEEETGLSIGIINLLGTVGLLLLPAVSAMMGLSEDEAGIFIGGTLQSMGHVVGAAFTLGEETGTLATVVKMGRILMIIPLLIVAYLMTLRPSAKSAAGLKGFPWFVPLFIGSIALAHWAFFPEGLSVVLAKVGDYLLVAAMVGIGFKIRLRQLFRIAGPALMAGVATFVFQMIIFIAFLTW